MRKAEITFQILTLGVGLTVAFLATDCKKDSPTSPTTNTPSPSSTTTTISPVQIPANVDVTVVSPDLEWWSWNPLTLRVEFPTTIRETAGTGVTIGFIRLVTMYKGPHSDDVVEKGKLKIIDWYGTNRIVGNGSLHMDVKFIFPVKSGKITKLRYTIGMTDDYGNDVTETSEWTMR